MDKLRPKKALGQNFLTDANILQRIVAAVEIGPDDAVLEVGPGRGALTELMAEKAHRLVAVELDRQLVPILRTAFLLRPNVEIVEADVLSVDLPHLLTERWGGRWKVAANLPYNISSQVLFRFLDCRAHFSLLVLMFQKEVGDRLLALPGTKEYGILSVFCRLHFDITRVTNVRPGAFHPVPKVDSVVLRFVPLGAPRVDVGDEAFFRRVVKAAFSQRRKTLWNCLRAANLAGSDDTLLAALHQCEIDGKRRGETLCLEEFAALARALAPEGEAGPESRQA
ncbi:MAG TPA: 16S rRNA (adenine(1518)-N(6)/adenine(1519)-N(6))-dimethyltransferase RsmA [Geobacteraceae bacterium]